MNKRALVISLNISCINFHDAIDQLLKIKKGFACFANVHMIIEAYRNKKIAKMINSSTFTFADGMPLLTSLKAFYNIKTERVAGMDVMPEILRKAEMKNISVFFYGSTVEVLTKISEKIKNDYPALKVAGMISPPFGKNDLELNKDIAIINKSGADLVFVALGCPKQEIWMANNTDRINAMLLGVGGAFPVFSGIQKRAPSWMQKYSMEWIFRLFIEPKRLFKRYFITNTYFIFLFFVTLLRMKKT